ncbi:hypothetical protein ACF0H5_010636 [Mactra antiquata]
MYISGGVIELSSHTLILDGSINVRGGNSNGPRAGGAGGGSVYIKVENITEDGKIQAHGGSSIGLTNSACHGGGGAGGRVTIYSKEDHYSGKITAHGGAGLECGGAGTVLKIDTSNGTKKLIVDNENVCTPLSSRVDWSKLSQQHRGQLSFYTWLFDRTTSHVHVFDEVHLSGQAQLALYRANDDTYTQKITVKKTSGDRSGIWHVGPYQEFEASLPDTSPELQFGVIVYENGVMLAEQKLTVTGITLANEGSLRGVEDLVIGPNGKIIIRPDSSSTSIPVVTFTSVTVQGGGTLVIETQGNGMKLVGKYFTVQSGGIVQADNLHVEAETLTVDDSAHITADKLAFHTDGGPGVGEYGRGAGHGGQGGKATNINAPIYGGGMFYDDFILPTMSGSNAVFKDFTNDIEVLGGGFLKFDISSVAHIDGVISSNGGDTESLAGGASGGSIVINTVTFNGKGKLTANGGKGSSTTGGGAGGRISLTYTNTEYIGSYVTYGGQSIHSTGGAGTVFVNENGKTKLYVDNKEPYTVHKSISDYSMKGVKDTDYSRTWLKYPNTTTTIFIDHIYLYNGAHLAVEPLDNTNTGSLIIESLNGDDFINDDKKLGTLHVSPNLTMTIRAIDLYFPANVVVYEKGLLELPSKIKWYNSDDIIHGTIGGVTELTLIKSTLKLMNTAKTQDSKIAANFKFSKLDIMSGGILEMIEDIQYKLEVIDQLYIAPSGLIQASKLTIVTNTAIIEEGGVIDLNGRGYYKSGPGYLQGHGAGHSGEGGGFFNSTTNKYIHGRSYDSYIQPRLPGSGGDNTYGGGVLKLQVSGTAEIEGEIKADGESTTSDNAGGASGGSIWITCNVAKIKGIIHTNGGSARTSGGGGGGYISIHYNTGYVDDLYITSYGGTTSSGEHGAAGVIFLDENGQKKALIKSTQATKPQSQSSHLVPLTTLAIESISTSTQINTVDIQGAATVGFNVPGSNPYTIVHIGTKLGNKLSMLRVDPHVEVYLSTRIGVKDELHLSTNVLVMERGSLDLPKRVILDKGWTMDVCGKLSTSMNEIIVREDGKLLMSDPANDLVINSLVIDDRGQLDGSQYCDSSGQKVILQVEHFNRTQDFTLDTTKFTLVATHENIMSPDTTTNFDINCLTFDNITLGRSQHCYLGPGQYHYSYISVGPGAELRLNGSTDGSSLTTIYADDINIDFTGIITGVGTGYQSGGPGSPTSSGKGASHGGRGVGNSVSTYGNIETPTEYGSNGPSATVTLGRGGGQIRLVVDETLTIEGTIDMSAGSGNGGSGGSILLEAKTITGDGYIKTEGSSGGGGGRIAVKASSTYTFTGTLSSEGGEDGSGNKGSSGTIYIESPGSKMVTISGESTETTSISTDISTLSIDNGATVSIENSNVTIGEIITSDSSCSLFVESGKALSVSKLGDVHRGFGCHLDINTGGSLTMNGRLLISGDQPKLNVHGTLTVSDLIIDNHGVFTISSTGKVITSSLMLSAWSAMSVSSVGMIGSDVTKVAMNTFEMGYNSSAEFTVNDLHIEATRVKIDSLAKLKHNNNQQNISIATTDFTMQDGAEIIVSKAGYLDNGAGSSSGLEGASYGGEGGKSSSLTYGSTTNPVDYGSGTSAARGGGIIILTVTGTAEVDGSLLANGGTSTSTGGGSGGTILIMADTIQGHGKLSVNGGESSAGGGGSGGRISLVAPSLSTYLGSMTAYGGNGASAHDAAGTIYLQYELSGQSKTKKVIIDNNGLVSEQKSHINGSIQLTELEINGNGQVIFDDLGTYDISTITGDNSGALMILSNQIMKIATSFGTSTPYALKCKLVINENGEATVPAKILLKDDDTTDQDWYNLEIYGTIIGVREMTVSSGGRVMIHSQSRSGLTSTDLKPIGTLSLNKIDVTTDGVLEISLDSMDQYTVDIINEINVKYGGRLYSKNLLIKSPDLKVAFGGILSVNGGNNNSSLGEGNAGTSGAGGSYGGAGRTSANSIKPSVDYVGDFTSATYSGSKGGDGSTSAGANGGGYLNLMVSNLLTLHGTISADGNNGSVDSGGGSGGGIMVSVTGIMEGSGTLSVKGGASQSGGGGGGGRIYIKVDNSFDFLGDYELCGGSSKSAQAGGSGTAYTVFKQSGTPGYVEYLYLDNACFSGLTNGVTVLDLPGESFHSLTNLDIGDNTKLEISTTGLHLQAKTLVCGTGSTIIVEDQCIFSANTDQWYSAIYCSFEVKQNGELRLPNTIELKGESSMLEGILTNIQTLVVSSYQQLTLSANVRTGICCDQNGNHTSLSNKGEYSFFNFILESYASVTFENDPTNLKTISFTKLELHYGSNISGDSLDIEASEINLHPGSLLTLQGGGYKAGLGPGAGKMINGKGTGGGHGSPGGSQTSDIKGGLTYDNTRIPYQPGSGGGSTLSGQGGAGGGYIRLKLYINLLIDGILQVDGDSGTGTDTGGGSGGTIHITTPTLQGDGIISSNGGKGQGRGGGGAGGRVAITIFEQNQYIGDMTALGRGNDNNLDTVKAGPGTIYLHLGKEPTVIHSIIITGDVDSTVQKQTYTYINGSSQTDFIYDSMTLTGYSNVIFGDNDTELRLANIIGDSTATLHITDHQVVRAAVVEGVIGNFTTNVNFIVGENAVLHVPETLIVAAVTLDIRGTCTFNKLIVEKGGTIQGYNTTYTSTYANGNYIPTSSPGNYTLSSIKLKAGSDFILPSGGLEMTIGTLEMKRFVVLEADFVKLTAINLLLERKASLSTTGKANINDDLIPTNAHGTGKNGGAHSAADGVLQSSGDSSTVGGGGAGGSIYIQCTVALKGLGSFEAEGGSVTRSDSGAGSGGHIAVDMKSDEFQGTYRASGGTSPAPHGDGGPGSIYLLSDTNGEKLIIDNENGQTDYYTTLNETKKNLQFDIVNIYNNAQLQLIADGQPREITILKVNGDGTGLVRIQNNQKGTLERSLTDLKANSKLKINLELHNGGEFLMSETVTILGLGNVALDLDGVLRGVTNLYLGPERKMRMGSHAKIVPYTVTDLSGIDYVTFGTFQLEPGSRVDYDAETGSKIQASNINLKFSSSISADYFNVSVTNLDIELESTLTCSSADRPQSEGMDVTTGSGSILNGYYGGSSHGGVGGGSKDVRGTAYNSLYKPIGPGSRGTYNVATNIKSGGKGGGWSRLMIGNLFINDGTISADGAAANSKGGGGSGGSVWIDVYEFEGYGIISVKGGDGTGKSGGGAAGRVAVYCTLEIEFAGTYIMYGGAGADDTQSAGGGTVYLEDIRNSIIYKRLLLHNQNRPHDKYATIDESFTDHYFDEVHLVNQASLHLADDNRNTVLKIDKTYGEGTGLIHLHKKQILKVEYKPAIRNAFLTGLNFIIDYDSEVYFPSIVYVYGRGVYLAGQTEPRSMAIFGRLTGIADLILGFETLVYFGDHAHTASIDAATQTHGNIDPAGTVTFGTVDLRSYSEIKYSPDQTVLQKIARIDARYQSVISAESITIQTGILNIEAGATLTSLAIYRPEDSIDEIHGVGVNATTDTNRNKGTGAGYATTGGGLYTSNKVSIVNGGNYFGSLYYPDKRGSRGGQGLSSNPGNGGGVINLEVATDLLVDGTISVDGSHGGNDASGGSGGTIYIQSINLEGHGMIQSNGGNGYCGGSGGRIATYLDTKIYYHGNIQSLGGDGNGHYLSEGGPGSVYIQDIRNTRQHEQFHIDNKVKSWDHYYILNEIGIRKYYFDEIHLTRNASIKLKSGDGIIRDLSCHKIYGDATGRIHLQANQTAYLEEYQTLTKLPVNLWIDDASKAYLSPLIYILGKGEIALKWNGEMIGVRHIRIVPGRVISIEKEAMTSFVKDGALVIGTPGAFEFASMELGAEARLQLPPPMPLLLTVGILDIKYNARFNADSMQVLATDFFLEPRAQLICVGTSRTTQLGDSLNIEAGGGHAAMGGGTPGNYSAGGKAYGSVYKPTDMGSSGGGAGGGLGGGKVKLCVPAEILLDGEILVDGNDGQLDTTRGGGGSGGSVFIEAGRIFGHGKISSVGGKGYTTSGGGAGGRIAIHTWDYNHYKGKLWAYGSGGTTTGDIGGPGTVFIEDKLSPFTYQTRLYLDGQGLVIPKPVIINEINPRHVVEFTQGFNNTNNALLDFEHLLLKQNAMLEIAAGTENIKSINLDYVMGDRTGYLHMKDDQTAFVEYSEYSLLRSAPPINFMIDKNSHIWLSADFKIIGEQKPAFQLDGHLIGVMNLTLEEKREMRISDTASNSRVENGVLHTFENGVLLIGRLAMQSGAVIDHTDHFNFEVSDIHMRYNSMITANRITVVATNIHMEGEASLDTTARGGEGNYTTSQGNVVTINGHNVGLGAGHGGYGGGSDHDPYETGKPYGSYIEPKHTGSKGGGTDAGMGGGRIDVRVSRGFHLDGNIVTLGGSAVSSDSGGGSGGSIHIVTQNFSGHGLLEATGGNGFGLGHGGSGGRIAVHIQWFKEYSGDIQTYGGFAGKNSPTTELTRNGAAGTIYTTDSNEIGLDKKEVKMIDGVLTYIDGYTFLLLDNDNRNHILGTSIMKDDNSSPYKFEFDEVEVRNHAVLWLDGDDTELVAHKFDGDRTGLMHLLGQQKVYAEYVESTSGYTVAPVSFKVEAGTEIVFPSTTIILGTRSDLSGLLTMVQNLTIADGANCVFTSTARTALIEAGKYVHLTKPGNISLSHLTIQRGSEATFQEKLGINLVLDLTKLSIKYEGLMWMNKGSIFSDNGVIESLGVLNIDYMGNEAENGLGAGRSSGSNGYGGAHGVHGGAPEPDVGGTPHDSVYKPTQPGSGGGNGDGLGGRGGGYLRWELGETLWIDGELTLEGEAGQSGNAGGGSGGGLFIETMNFTGFGHIDCHGGAGRGNGGGGAGSRIGIHINFANRYIGRLNVIGGLGTGTSPSGAAGTVYLQENNRGPQYADIKYEDVTGDIIVTAQHRRIEINNDHIDKHLYVNHKEPWLYTVLFENTDTEYEFDEAVLEGHSNLLIEYPTGTVGGTGWAVEVKIHLFHGDHC